MGPIPRGQRTFAVPDVRRRSRADALRTRLPDFVRASARRGNDSGVGLPRYIGQGCRGWGEWEMSERRRRVCRRASEVLALVIGSLLLSMSTASASLPVTNTPQLGLSGTIKTSPFVGSTTIMKDNEDIAYVPRDNSIWLVDDNADSAYESTRSREPQTTTEPHRLRGRPFAGRGTGGRSESDGRPARRSPTTLRTTSCTPSPGTAARRPRCRRRSAWCATAVASSRSSPTERLPPVATSRPPHGTAPTGRPTSGRVAPSVPTITSRISRAPRFRVPNIAGSWASASALTERISSS